MAAIGETAREHPTRESRASEPPKPKAQGNILLMKGDEGPQSQIATRIPRGLHKRVKVHCEEMQVKIRKFIIEALNEKLDEVQATRGV